MKPTRVVSDVHLDTGGLPLAEARSKFFRDTRRNAGRLIIVGDLVDLLMHRWSSVYNNETFAYTAPEVRATINAIETHFIPGNHDWPTLPDFEHLAEWLAPAVVWTEGVVDSLPRLDGFRFEHGHRPEWDPTTTLWETLVPIGRKVLGEDALSRFVAWAAKILLKPRDSKDTPRDVLLRAIDGPSIDDWDRYHVMVRLIQGAQWQWLDQTQGELHTLVTGHTHYARYSTKHPQRDIHHFDLGALDGVSQMTYIEIDEAGKARLKRFIP